MYQGSKAPGESVSKVDWLDNDLPMTKNIVARKQAVTPQLKSAANALNQVLKDFSRCHSSYVV
ncbi:hypothetical protein GUT183_03280 [Streptococcus ruminantium]|nr:hypothetical protein GUT183_03280 [Streptococcus ruminantium]